MEDSKIDNHETEYEIIPLRRNNARRQCQQLRFSEEEKEEEKPEKSRATFKALARAARFLSICDPSLQLSGASLLRLQQLHSQATNNKGPINYNDISDELLDTIPFQYDQ
jgi:hypothetical protein